MLVIAALGLAVFGVFVQETSSEIRNMNVYASGVLIGFIEVEGSEAMYAEVSYDIPGDPRTTLSQQPIVVASKNAIGRTFVVFYDPDDPSKTFIQGIDQLRPPVLVFAAAACAALMGLAMIVRPPENAQKADKQPPRPPLPEFD